MKQPPTPEEKEALKTLLDIYNDVTMDDRADLMTEWEGEEFLPSLQTQTIWSERQREVLDRIWKKVME